VEEFRFQLVNSLPYLDICTYHVSVCGEFCILFCFEINVSNVDFGNFIWQNFERFGFKKYSLTLIPPPSFDDVTTPPSSGDVKLAFLKYYRAESEGWKDSAQCVT
jgi:hypothetical protein